MQTTILRVRVDEDTERMLKRYAAEEQTTVSQIVRDALARYFEDENGHIARTTEARRRPTKREDKPLPRHSDGLRLGRLFEDK